MPPEVLRLSAAAARDACGICGDTTSGDCISITCKNGHTRTLHERFVPGEVAAHRLGQYHPHDAADE